MTRAQNARTRALSSAKATNTRTPRTVRMNSVARMCEANHDRSKASRLAKSGGLGNTPRVNAKVSTGMAITASKISSTAIELVTAG